LNYKYQIAELNMNITSDCDYLIKRMESFQVDSFDKSDLNVKMKHSDSLHADGEIIIQDNGVGWMNKENTYVSCARIHNQDDILTVLEVEKNWLNANIEYSKKSGFSITNNNIDYGDFNAFHMVGVLFRYSILNHQGIVVHASSIDFNGKGIIFTAPAGTGKSTHVKLWEKYLGSQIKVINDDTPVLKQKKEGNFIYGTPWSGSSDKFLNTCVPLSAIVIIERAEKNSITQLSVTNAATKLMPRFFLPYFDKDLMNKAVTIYEKIISQTPVYLLKCTPEKEAMEIVYQCIQK